MPNLTVFSLNIFGSPRLFGYRRMIQMAKILNQLNADVICLQEVQSNEYLPALARLLTNTPHLASHNRRTKPIGGLVSASKREYLEVAFHSFPERGKKWSIGYADWALQKGVLMTRFEVDGFAVVVMNTHLQANYLAGWSNANTQAIIQTRQIEFLSSLVKEQEADALVIVCGDFNFPPHAFLYSFLLESSGLSDPLQNDPRPSYQPFPLVSSSWATRLDYALYRAPRGVDLHVSSDIQAIKDENARYPWGRFITDHFLLALGLHWST